MARKKAKKTKLEKQYYELFRLPARQHDITMPDTLVQPSPLKVVPSVATGAGYQEPIKMD